MRTSQAKRPFSAKKNQNYFACSGHIWKRNREDVSSQDGRFWNATIDSTTVSVCKIVRTPQAKRPFSKFFKTEKRTQRDRRNCEDVSAQTPDLEKSVPFSPIIFFINLCANPGREIVRTSQATRPFSCLWFFLGRTKKSAGDNTKLWGRLTPNARFAPQKNQTIYHFVHGFDRGTGGEIVRTSQAKVLFSLFDFCFFPRKNSGENAKLSEHLKRNACFPQKKIRIFFMFGHIWKRNREDVSSQDVRFWNATMDSTNVSVCKIVRTSQAKRPVLKFFKQKKN